MDRDIKALLWEAEHHQKTNWILSVEILEKVIKKAPETLAAHEMLYNIYMHNSLYKKVEKILLRALTYIQNNDQLYFLMGNLFLAQRDKAWLAIEWYQKVKNKFPVLEFNLAVAFVHQNRRREAIAILKKIFPHFENLVSTFTLLAEQYIVLNEYDEAINLLTIAEKKFSTNKSIYYLIGICYDKKQNWLQAYLHYEKAKELGYSTAELFNALGKCCQNIGDIEKAIIYFGKSISQNIFFIKSYLDLCKLYILEGDFLNAKKYLNFAKKIDPLNIYVALTSKKLKQLEEDRDKK